MSDVPPARQCAFPTCEREATDPGNSASLCETHMSGISESEGGEKSDSPDVNPGLETEDPPSDRDGWDDADFTAPESDVWPPELLEREQWMGHKPGEKQPYAPWTDHDAPAPCSRHDDGATCAECDHSARYKWGWSGNYLDGEGIALAEDDPRLGGRVFLQQPDDPYTYVDGDDVRDPETGGVHPEFVAILKRLGVTYADISTSGAGVHAQYTGELPEGVKEAKWQLDEDPWGANDDLPSIEIYAGKRVCVATGEHVPGTPTDVREWDADALRELLEEHDQMPDARPRSTDRDDYDLEDYEPAATGRDETTDDIRDIFAALDRLDARRVADRTIVHRWNDSAGTSDGARAFYPTWGMNSNGTANYVNDRIWHDTGDVGGYGGPVVMALIDAGEISNRNATPRDATGELWWKGIEYLRDLGFSIPEYEPSDDPDLEVTLDPADAWRAAESVTPEDVDGELSLQQTPDQEAWRCPGTDAPVDVVRAVAIDEGLIDRADDSLRDADYDAAYRIARDRYNAPLPEYVTAATATDRWAVIQGALEQFTHRHLSAIRSTVTGLGDDGRAVAEIDPCWAYSASGTRIVALENGAFYCRNHERTLDPLRFIALETGIIDECDDALAGEAFKTAYHTAREEYGAPLPEWTVGDPDHIPVLPPADDLVGEFTTDIGSLSAAREKVESLYRSLADDGRTPHVLNALPALGKTTSVVKNADEYPALYLGPRKELQQEVAQKAERHGISYMHLPVFAERQVSDEAKNQALAIVRDEGKDVLRDRDALVDRLDHPVFSEDEDGSGDDVSLDRASCPTANGEHGEAWALAFQVARELGHTPQEILTRGAALFGEEPPTDGEEDPYSQAWRQATDPGTPVDLLIGGYGHAHVGGARTYYHEREGQTKRDPRVVAIDEFPGLDPYQTSFGERYLDHAAWLARCLRDDVDDKQDVFERDLWGDEWVRAWVEGHANDVSTVDRARTALRAMQDALTALDAIDDVRAEYPGAVASLGLDGVLSDVVDCHPEWGAERAQRTYHALVDAVEDGKGTTGGERAVLNRLAKEALPPLASFLATFNELPEELAANAIPGRVSGDLLDLCTTACEMFTDRDDGASGVIEATRDALKGGEDGCRALAIHARDGYAHPDAHLLLYGQLANGDATSTVHTESYTFGGDEDTNLKRTTLGRATILVDRNHHGAAIHQPPEFTPNGGGRNPVVGLDATANERLWSRALGLDVEIADIHDSQTERERFLRDVLNLQVVQTTPHVNTYSGSTASKNFDGDVELVKQVAREYSGAAQLRRDTLTGSTKPGVITTKKVEEEISGRVEGSVSMIDHYGNVTGSNALDRCNVGVVLGARHYGDAHVEKWAAFAGEDVRREGHGTDLDYGSETANAVLGHMREDETMQAILRFGRDEEGAIVFAHTAALRDDLPVVAEGEVVQAHSESAKAVARAAREHRGRAFTAGDLAGEVDCSRRTVRRVLAGFADLGYVDRTETPNGKANEYRKRADPGVGNVDLPEIDLSGGEDPDETALIQYYTWSVRVDGEETPQPPSSQARQPVLPAPDAATAGPPPG